MGLEARLDAAYLYPIPLREPSAPPAQPRLMTQDTQPLSRIARRAFVQMVAMIYAANHRDDHAKEDPKVGGHPAACASCIEILTALHAVVREPDDFVCCKPHASPNDHALHHLLPAVPYHALGTLHRRLSRELPQEAEYHQAEAGGVFATVRDLWTRAQARETAPTH